MAAANGYVFGRRRTAAELERAEPALATRNIDSRAEWFNLANHVKFDVPNTNIGATNPGFVTAQANRPRTLQVALKLVF